MCSWVNVKGDSQCMYGEEMNRFGFVLLCTQDKKHWCILANRVRIAKVMRTTVDAGHGRWNLSLSSHPLRKSFAIHSLLHLHNTNRTILAAGAHVRIRCRTNKPIIGFENTTHWLLATRGDGSTCAHYSVQTMGEVRLAIVSFPFNRSLILTSVPGSNLSEIQIITGKCYLPLPNFRFGPKAMQKHGSERWAAYAWAHTSSTLSHLLFSIASSSSRCYYTVLWQSLHYKIERKWRFSTAYWTSGHSLSSFVEQNWEWHHQDWIYSNGKNGCGFNSHSSYQRIPSASHWKNRARKSSRTTSIASTLLIVSHLLRRFNMSYFCRTSCNLYCLLGNYILLINIRASKSTN